MTVTLLLRTRSETRSDRDTRSCVRQTYTHTRTHRLMQAMARCSLAHSTTRTRSVLQRETDAVVARSIDLSTRPPSPDLVLILYRLTRRFIFWSSPHYLSHLSFALTLGFLACGMDLRQRTLRERERVEVRQPTSKQTNTNAKKHKMAKNISTEARRGGERGPQRTHSKKQRRPLQHHGNQHRHGARAPSPSLSSPGSCTGTCSLIIGAAVVRLFACARVRLVTGEGRKSDGPKTK